MQLEPFKLERFFARYEFAVKYLLSSSDGESMTVPELLSYASAAHRTLWDELRLGYTESKGHPLLLDAIAQLYEGIEAVHVLEVVPEEGIFIAMNSLLQAGDHVIVSYPAYQSLYQVAQSIGCTLSRWTPQSGPWQFDPAQLADLIQPNTKLIVINFPHNPTGAMLTQEQFQHVIDLARQHHCWVFSDEMYRWSEYEAGDRLPAACEVYERAVSLSGLSKTFGLPGLRVGWLVTRDAALMQRFTAFKDYTTICSSAPSEILAIIALAAKEDLIQRTLGILRANLSLLDAFFARHTALLAWQRPRAGTLTMVELVHPMPVEQLAEELVHQQVVMIVPASQFELEGNYFRLGFGRRNLPEALDHFEVFLRQMPR